ncbi:MAG: flavin monoamine oxidase family protein [bacterium]
MSDRTIDYPLVIVGAGAAGLGASVQATKLGIPHLVLEASHRTGGRGLTENLDNGVPVDLGCHWMHCARNNPFVAIADHLGYQYETSNPDYRVHLDGDWARESIAAARKDYLDLTYNAVMKAYAAESRDAIWDYMDQESASCGWASYWLSLMHSNDPDQVSISDIAEFDDTNEDWPLRQGYGALIVARGVGCPVRLNSPVTAVHWNDHHIKVVLAEGEITTKRVLLTVSTGVLGAGEIKFVPELPVWKRQAIHDLPLGNYNNLFFPINPGKLLDAPAAISYERDESFASVRIRPFDDDYLFVTVAGRFAWWLEKQGEQVSSEWLTEILVDIFGAEVRKQIGRFRASAWGFDPWVKGAYSSTTPGASEPRRRLAEPIDQKIYFAGEAASIDQFNTAHGAWISGQLMVLEMQKEK